MKGTARSPKSSFSVSLERGLAVLSVFATEPRLLGIADLARILGMNASTVHRYVRTLTSLGYLQQDRFSRKYRLGFKVADLGLAVINSLDVTDVARPHLRALATEWELTVNMAILDGPEIVYVERIVGSRSMDLHLQVGSRQPAHCTSMGKVLLAFLDDSTLDSVIEQIDFMPRGQRSISDPETLKVELRRVRDRGFGINNEELAPGLRSVAAPVRNAQGLVVAAVNIHASPYKISEIVELLAPVIVKTADVITCQLGGRPSATTGGMRRDDCR